MARERITVNPAKMARLDLPINCQSVRLLAKALGISKKTLERRSKEDDAVGAAVKSTLAEQKQRLDDELTRECLDRALDRKDPESGKLLIWSMKAYLGYSDNQTIRHEGGISVEYVNDWRKKREDDECPPS